MSFFSEPLLAIETSCDETSAAVLIGQAVLSNIVASQIDLHKKWGGVVPEAAARAHVEAILPVIEEALSVASLELRDIRGIAVTNRPGLVGALSVGVTAAKALSFSLGVPLIGVHHLEGHLCSVLAVGDAVGSQDHLTARRSVALPGEMFPHTALVVSGGHTELVQVRGLGDYEIVGMTRDDAAGEAFDKGARLLGLGYPGGFAIQESAKSGDARRYPLPRGLSGDTMDFSFSGLKTAVLRLVEKEGAAISVPDAAASLQEAIVSVLVERSMRAAEALGSRALSLVGGVAANLELRRRLGSACENAGIQFLAPPLNLCTDNAAMIGLAGSFRLARGERDGFDLDVFPNAELA